MLGLQGRETSRKNYRLTRRSTIIFLISAPRAARNGPQGPGERAIDKKIADYTRRSTIIFLISAIALAGFKPLGQVLAQLRIV